MVMKSKGNPRKFQGNLGELLFHLARYLEDLEIGIPMNQSAAFHAFTWGLHHQPPKPFRYRSRRFEIFAPLRRRRRIRVKLRLGMAGESISVPPDW